MGATDATGTGISSDPTHCMHACMHRCLRRATSENQPPFGPPPSHAKQASTPHPCQSVCLATPPRQIRGRGAHLASVEASWAERRTIFSKQPERTNDERHPASSCDAATTGPLVHPSNGACIKVRPAFLRSRPHRAPKQAIRPRPSHAPINFLGGCPAGAERGPKNVASSRTFQNGNGASKSLERTRLGRPASAAFILKLRGRSRSRSIDLSGWLARKRLDLDGVKAASTPHRSIDRSKQASRFVHARSSSLGS